MTDEGDVYMLDDKSSTEPLTDSGQYTLRDIFFLTTLTAILVFLAMPLGGLVSRAAIIFWITLALVEFSAVVTIFRYLSKRRQNLLAITGAKWGNGFVVEWTWSGWPHLKAWLYLLGLAGYALLQNALVTWMLNSQLTQKVPLPVSFLPMLSQLWIMPLFLFLLARALCQVAWRVYPDTVEFYEHGICFNFAIWHKWQDVELRPSTIYKDRLVAVFKPIPFFPYRFTEEQIASIPRQQHLVQLDRNLKQRVLNLKTTDNSP